MGKKYNYHREQAMAVTAKAMENHRTKRRTESR